MKKALWLTICISLILSLFIGCQNANTSSSKDVTTIRVWTSDAGGKSVWEQLVNDFNAGEGKEKGIKIEWVTYGSDWLTTLDVARQNGQLPEIAAVSDIKGYAATGDIIPLTDLPGGEEFLKEYNTELLQGRNKIGDTVYNVSSSSNVPGLIYNKDLFKQKGLVDENGEAVPPKTWEEVREYAKILTDPQAQVYGLAFPMKDPSLFFNYMLRTHFASSFGNMAVYDYDKLTVSFDNYKYPYNWMMDIKQDASMFPGAESLDNDTARAYFAEGKIGMLLGLSWDVGVLTTQFEASCDWGVAEPPVAQGVERQPTWRDLSGSFTVCKSALEVDLEKVMDVYRFLFSANTRQKMYENGIRLSSKKDVVESADVSQLPPQFVEFAQLLDEEFEVKIDPALKLNGDAAPASVLEVWTGAVGVDEAIAALNERYTAALQAGVADGSIQVELYQ